MILLDSCEGWHLNYSGGCLCSKKFDSLKYTLRKLEVKRTWPSSSCRVWQEADIAACLLQNTLYELSLGRPEHVETEEEVIAGLACCVWNLPAKPKSAATVHGKANPLKKTCSLCPLVAYRSTSWPNQILQMVTRTR